MLSDEQIAALGAAEKLALAQRLLAALSQDLGTSTADIKPLSPADMKALQASLATQVHQSLGSDPASTDWNALRNKVLRGY